MESFSALLAICAGNSPVTAQRPVTRSFDVYFDLRPNKRLSKQSWGWWFETPSRPLWCHRTEVKVWPSCPDSLTLFSAVWSLMLARVLTLTGVTWMLLLLSICIWVPVDKEIVYIILYLGMCGQGRLHNHTLGPQQNGRHFTHDFSFSLRTFSVTSLTLDSHMVAPVPVKQPWSKRL